MPKIRGVKPDYWTDERIVELSIPARLLFIGLWNYACDNGHLQDIPKQIKVRILPGDDVNCADLLREIEGQQLIGRSGGWITIPNLSHHQKPHRSWWRTCDKPGCMLPEGASRTPGQRGATVVPPKGNRVATADGESESESDGEGESSPRAPRSEMEPDRFEEFWATYDKRRGRKAAVAKYRLALNKPAVTDDLLISAAASYVEWQRDEGKHPQFTKDPATWLNGEHWTDERVVRQPQQTRMQEHLSLVQQLAVEEAHSLRQIGGGQ